MFLNCPNVLLQLAFVQSLVCCDLTLKYVSSFQSMFAELILVIGSLDIEFAEQQCGKNTFIDVKNFNTTFNFQSDFSCK